MGQEHSTSSNRDRQKRGNHRSHTSHNRDPDPTRIVSDHRRTPHSSKCSTSSSSGYTTAISRTNSTTSSSLSGTNYSNHLPIYTNVHYRDVNNNDIYKPLKINKNNVHRLKILNADKDTAIYLEKHLSIKSYLNHEDVKKKKSGSKPEEPAQKKAGIRNYTPKILSEKGPQKDLEHWI